MVEEVLPENFFYELKMLLESERELEEKLRALEVFLECFREDEENEPSSFRK